MINMNFSCVRLTFSEIHLFLAETPNDVVKHDADTCEQMMLIHTIGSSSLTKKSGAADADV